MYERQVPTSEPSDESTLDEATSMLDRVKVMRVFDFSGLAEAVGEVAEACDDAGSHFRGFADVQKARKFSVADSEEEIDEEDELQDEQSESSQRGTDKASLRPVSEQRDRIGMLFVDTVANIIGMAMAKSQAQGEMP